MKMVSRYTDWMESNTSIQSVNFSGHESFPLRFAWLTKAVRQVLRDPSIFGRDEAVVVLGVGKNMVRSIRHWATRTGVIESDRVDRRGGRYKPTELGKLLFAENGLDPYLEDPATTWLIHWQLCSRNSDEYLSGQLASPTTWYWVFNELRQTSFSQEDVVDELLRWAEGRTKKLPSRSTIERDFACFVRSYISVAPDRRISKEETYDSPLTDLKLLRREPESDRLVLERGKRLGLSPLIFAYALCEFWQATALGSDTLSFEQVTYQPGSPGQVFRLTENACVGMLESIYEITEGSIGFDSTAGVRQLIRHAEFPVSLQLLMKYYEEASVADCT